MRKSICFPLVGLRSLFWSTGLGLLMQAGMAAAAVPAHFAYEGRLSDENGQVLNEEVTIKFALFDALENGAQVWPQQGTEDHRVRLVDGVFQVQVGSTTPLTASKLVEEVYLEVQVQGADGSLETLSPRQPLVSAPYALRASLAEGVDNGDDADVEIKRDGTAVLTLTASGLTVKGEITADDGAVEIAGENGLVVSGTFQQGSEAPSGAGTRMLFSPLKAAFRAGGVSGSQWDNDNTGNYSVALGEDGLAAGDYATVAGGGSNTVEVDFGTIGGGYDNSVGGPAGDILVRGVTKSSGGGTVSGGEANEASGGYPTIGGGYDNLIEADFGTIGGGYDNSVGGPAGDILTRGERRIPARGVAISSGGGGTVSGGEANEASGGYPTIGGGFFNTVEADFGTIGGGYDNIIGGDAGDIFDRGERQTQARGGTVLGTGGGTVSGGESNEASGGYPTIGGGLYNTIDADYGTIGGGYDNVVGAFTLERPDRSQRGLEISPDGTSATVAGGESNAARGSHSTVAGGGYNEADGSHSTVAGGEDNTADGDYSTVPGGQGNSAQGQGSFAAGTNATALYDGSFVWADYSDPGVSFSEDDTPLGSFGGVPVPNAFIARAHGGFWFETDQLEFRGEDGGGAGVILRPGEGAWTSLSDRNAKANFAPVDGRQVLDKVAALPIQTWNYQGASAEMRHMGPMAQDFYAAFALGQDERYITTVDADGVALAAIQGLHQLVQEQTRQIEALQADNARLQQQVDRLQEPEQVTQIKETTAAGQVEELAARLALLENMVQRLTASGAVEGAGALAQGR